MRLAGSEADQEIWKCHVHPCNLGFLDGFIKDRLHMRRPVGEAAAAAGEADPPNLQDLRGADRLCGRLGSRGRAGLHGCHPVLDGVGLQRHPLPLWQDRRRRREVCPCFPFPSTKPISEIYLLQVPTFLSGNTPATSG
jgi:hypothetical protein